MLGSVYLFENLNHGCPQILRKPKEERNPFSLFLWNLVLFFFSCIFFISLYSWKVNCNPEGWKQARWQPQSPRDAAERMLGLLNSHVDPPNSLLSLCVSVFCLRGSGSEPPPPSPVHVHTHLAGRSSGALHSCQPAQPARFITSPEFCIWGLARGNSWFWRREWQAALPPTESFHIHGLIQILALYVGSYRRLRKTPKLVLSLRQLSRRNKVSYIRPARVFVSGIQGQFYCKNKWAWS